MNGKFTLEFCSDLDYEELVADIYFEQSFIALVTQEKGIDNIEIELSPKDEKIKSLKLPLNYFIDILMKARSSLVEKQKYSD